MNLPSVKISCSWTNWTIGFWWNRSRRSRLSWGIDLGPIEIIVYKKKKKFRVKSNSTYEIRGSIDYDQSNDQLK